MIIFQKKKLKQSIRDSCAPRKGPSIWLEYKAIVMFSHKVNEFRGNAYRPNIYGPLHILID